MTDDDIEAVAEEQVGSPGIVIAAGALALLGAPVPPLTISRLFCRAAWMLYGPAIEQAVEDEQA